MSESIGGVHGDARPSSLWELDAPPIVTDDALPLRTDVIVVGAGITGLTTALLLARRGWDVVVVESRRVGAGTTGNTTGKVSLLQGDVYSRILSRAGYESMRAYARANVAAQDWLRRELAGSAAWEPRPAWTYATTSAGDHALSREAAALSRAGIRVDKVGAGDDIGLPFRVTRAMRLDGQAQIQPLVLLAQLAAQVRELGGRIVENARLTRVSISGDEVTAITTAGPLTGHHIVLATGTPVLDRSGFFAKTMPSRQLVAAYRAPELPGMYLSLDPNGHSARGATHATAGTVLVIGGSSFVTGRHRSTLAALHDIDEWAGRHFDTADRVTWWAAQDYRMARALPYAGFLPRGGGRILAATGYNKWGMTNAVAAALSIAEKLTADRLPPQIDLHSPQLSIRALLDAVAFNAGVARHMVAGYARGATARSSHALREGEGRVVRRGATLVAESRVEGATCRVSAVCTHLGGVLRWNDAERSWDCPLHASRFDPVGSPLEGPGVHALATYEP